MNAYSRQPLSWMVSIQMLKDLLEEAEFLADPKRESLKRNGRDSIGRKLPELWIMNDEDYPRAREIVETGEPPALKTHDPWVCTHCSER